MLSRNFARFFADQKKSAPFWGRKALPGIGRIILTASCKGGVGKSTVALNTAIALNKCGAKVGLFDADIYGPSVPTMTKSVGQPLVCDKNSNFIPVDAHGICTVSVGNAIDKDAALLWKGPMVDKIMTEFLRNAIWPALDYLVIDSPPGTGDVHMGLASQLPIDGAVIVTTPQQIAVADVVRTVEAYKKMKVPILGIVQNMDGFVCEHCKTISPIFPGKGGKELAARYGLDFLGSIPVDPAIAQAGDSGTPAIITKPNSEYSKAFLAVAKRIIEKCPKQAPRYPPREIPK